LGRVLLNRAAVLEAMCEPEQALQVLQEAAPLVADGKDPRLLYGAYYAKCSNLCLLGRHSEAVEVLKGAFQAAAELGNELDLVRLRALQGRVDAGRGRTADALISFEAALRHFDREKMAYDFALLSLEAAELRLTLGQYDEVTRMVQGMLWVFRAERIHREAVAGLILFKEAVESGHATAELARRIHRHLEGSGCVPVLRFADREPGRPSRSAAPEDVDST
jgi:tetratricopeptide (TPR) repeat protein